MRPWRRDPWDPAPPDRGGLDPARTRGAAAAGPRVRASCVLLAGADPGELEGAGQSALEQTLPFDEVLVAEPDPQGRAGELERLQHTLGVARGEVICFLRAEDRFEPEHLARRLAVFETHPGCAVVDGAWRRFGRREEVAQRRDGAGAPQVQAALARTRDPARLAVPALSALALRREPLAGLMPFPREVLGDWERDPCEPLLRAVLATGAPRGYVAEPGVRVRVDDAAFDSRRGQDRLLAYRRRLALARLWHHLDARLGHGPTLARLAALEFGTLERPSRLQLAAYLELALQAEVGLGDRVTMLASILVRHFAPRLR